MVSLKLNNGTDDLFLDGPAIRCFDWSDLYLVGSSRGRNLAVAHADGTVQRGRDRDELAATLSVRLDGTYDLAGAIVALSDRPGQVRKLMRALSEHVADGEDRSLTVTLVDGGDTFTAGASFEEFGRPQAVAAHLWEVRVLLVIAAGIMTEVVE